MGNYAPITKKFAKDHEAEHVTQYGVGVKNEMDGYSCECKLTHSRSASQEATSC